MDFCRVSGHLRNCGFSRLCLLVHPFYNCANVFFVRISVLVLGVVQIVALFVGMLGGLVTSMVVIVFVMLKGLGNCLWLNGCVCTWLLVECVV